MEVSTLYINKPRNTRITREVQFENDILRKITRFLKLKAYFFRRESRF